MSWIVIVTKCNACGGGIAFELFETEPTKEEINYVYEKYGSFSCGNIFKTEIEEGINVIENE